MKRLLVLLSLSIFSASSIRADELRTLGGKIVSGTLAKITDAEIIVKTNEGETATPMSQVLALDIRPVKGVPAGAKYTDVKLLDDSVLHCQKVAFGGKEVELTLLSGAKFKVPLNGIVWVLQDAHDEAIKRKFDDLLGQKVKRDRILILRDGELNPLDGTLGEVDAKGTTIQFTRDGAPALGVLFERLHGLIFYRTEAPSETPICRVYDAEGNSLVATKLAYDGSTLTLTTSFGPKIALPQPTLARLDFNLGKLTFLSDMEPTKVVERSALGLPTPYRKDANLLGEQILFEKPHAKGISMHAYTELHYNLAGKYKEFKAILGVDHRYLENVDSKAVVSIYCDGEKRFSETVGLKPRPIALNVKDVTTLRIVVSAPGFLDTHHHATLADARVSQ